MRDHPDLLNPATRLRLTLAAATAACALSAAAAEPPPAVPEAAQVAPAAAASATDAYSGFRREFDAARYEAAIPYAERVLQLAEQSAPSPTDETVQVALMNLGMTQNLANDYVAAESTYLRAIDLVQRSGRPLHARRARVQRPARPLHKIGRAHV